MPNSVLSTKDFPANIRERLTPILANGDFHRGDNLERMGSGSKFGTVCSMRLNKESRVMMAFVMLESQPTWILLQVLENHNYQDAKALKKGWLDRFLKNNSDSLSFQLREALKAKNDSEEEVTELEYHNDHWIVLTDEQQNAHCLKGTVIVMGMPGSGKTLLAQTMAIAEAQVVSNNNDDDNDANDSAIAYITKSKDLADSMRSNVRAVVGEQSSVQVFDFANLPQELRPTNDDEKHNYLENCLTWLATNKLGLDWAELGFENAAEMNQLLYREFRIISGCASPETFYNLGRRQALFAGEERAAVYTIYTQYLKSELGSIDYSLTRIKPQSNKRFKRIFLDESQDFSDAELADLSALCDGQIVCLIDSNQSLVDVHSKADAIKRLLSRDLCSIVLPYSFRCSQAVTEAANALLNIKHQAMGGVLEKHAETQVKTEANAEPGKAIWLEHQQKQTQVSDEIIDLQKSMGTTQRIVITWPEYFAEAKALFPRALVATPAHAKGLEFDEVVAYHLLDEKHFSALNRLLGSDEEYCDKGSRAKASRDRRELGPDLNQVFTAFTRARKQLIVVDDSQCHKTRTLTARVKKVCSDMLTSTTLESTSPEEWYKQAQKYLRKKRFELAKQVCDTYLDAGAYDALIKESESTLQQLDSSTASTSIPATQVEKEAPAAPAKSKQAKKKRKGNAKPTTARPKKPLSTVDDLFKAVRGGDLNAVKIHLKNGVSPIAKQYGTYPIHIAALRGHLHIVRYLYEQGEVSNHLLTDDHNTPIHFAAETGHLEIIIYLHQMGVDLSLQNIEGENALILATRNNREDIIKYCSEHKQDFTVTDGYGKPLLFIALKLAYLSLAELLIKLGCDVAQLDKNGFSLLDYSIVHAGGLPLVKFLHSHGADLNAPDGKGMPCIEVAIENDSLDVLCYLHENGVPLDQLFKSKLSPLLLAMARNNLSMVQYMVEKGASLEFPSRPDWRPLASAIVAGRLELTQYLIKMGAQINDNTTDDCSSLYRALYYQQPHVALFLISEGVNVDQGMRSGYAPLHAAVEFGYLDVVKALCARGAKVDAEINRVTALHYAASFNRYDEALCLLDAGANINARNQYGETPLMIAVRLGHTNLVRVLIKRGADVNLANIHGAAPVHVAHNILGLNALIEGKANFNVRTESGLSPVVGAVILGDLRRLMCLVENGGANPLLPDKDGMTPLTRATILGVNLSIITYLLMRQNNYRLSDVIFVAVPKVNIESFLKMGPLEDAVKKRFNFLFFIKPANSKAQVRFFDHKKPADNTIELSLNQIAWALGHKHLEPTFPIPEYLKHVAITDLDDKVMYRASNESTIELCKG